MEGARSRRDSMLWATAIASGIGLVALTMDLAFTRKYTERYESSHALYKTLVELQTTREPSCRVIPERQSQKDSLSEYPYTFINSSFEGYLVIGEAAQAEDVIGRCDIATPSSR